MTDYPLVKAKEQLSRLIDKALAGEEVTITRHGKPVVDLRPRSASGQGRPKSALIDEIAAWPGGEKGRIHASQPGGKFLVIAASLPFSRLKINDADYRRLVNLSQKDQDATEPLRSAYRGTRRAMRPGVFIAR